MTFPSSSYPSICRKFFWCLVLATLVVASVIIVPKIATPRPAVDSKVLGLRVMLCALGLAVFTARRHLFSRSWGFADSIYAGLLASFTLSLIFSGRVSYCMGFSWHHAALIATSWAIYRFQPTASNLRALLWLIGILAGLASLYGFLTYIGHDILRSFFPFDFEENQGGRNFIHSFFGNPEYFAGYVAPGALVMVGLAAQVRSRLAVRILWLALAGFVLLVLALSGSRSAFAGFAISTFIVLASQFFRLERGTKRFISWGAIAAAVMGIAGGIILSTPNALNRRDMRLFSRFAEAFNTQSASFRERINFYLSTADAIPRDPIFGSGPGTFRLEFLNNMTTMLEHQDAGISKVLLIEMRNRLAEHTHNDNLEVWFDQGTLGFGMFLLLIVYMVVRFISTRMRITRTHFPSEALLDYHSILFGACTAMFINALTSFPFQMPARATLAWILIGSFFAVDKRVAEAAQPRSGMETSNRDNPE